MAMTDIITNNAASTRPLSTSLTPVAETSEAGSTGAPAVDFQSFLQLLTAQLRYQDPLAPLDSTQFVAQLAGFSTVEQLVNANRRLDEIAARLDEASAPAA